MVHRYPQPKDTVNSDTVNIAYLQTKSVNTPKCHKIHLNSGCFQEAILPILTVSDWLWELCWLSTVLPDQIILRGNIKIHNKIFILLKKQLFLTIKSLGMVMCFYNLVSYWIIVNTKKYHVFAAMGRFQLESIYLYFPPSSLLH